MRSVGLRLGFVLALAACSTGAPHSAAAQADQPSLGQSFVLKAGDSVTLSDAKVRVRFESVLADSRCPVGKQCVRAGNVRVLLQVAVDGGKDAAVEVDTEKGNGKATTGDFQVTLEKVEPPPTMPRSIAPGDYRITISLQRR
jgi:hypothetical protein